MKEFTCSKCNSKDVFIEKSGNNTGLYCGNCGKWITWLNKDQLRLAERQIAARSFDMDKVLEQLEDYGKYKGILLCEGENFDNYIPISVANKEILIRLYEESNYGPDDLCSLGICGCNYHEKECCECELEACLLMDHLGDKNVYSQILIYELEVEFPAILVFDGDITLASVSDAKANTKYGINNWF